MWATRFRERSAETEQIIAGNCVMLIESKPWTIYWFSQGQKKKHLNRMWEIQFRETSPDTEQIKYNTNGIETASSKKIICSKPREGTAESSGAKRFSDTSADVQ